MLALLAATVLAAAQPPPASNGWKCNYARIRGDGVATVRSGSRAGSRIVARLGPGEVVYTCDETRTHVQIRFATPKASCPLDTAGLDHRVAETCPSGWVRQDQVEALSG